MSTSLTSQFGNSISWNYVNTDASGKQTVDQNSDSYTQALSQGSGSNGTADLKYQNIYTIAGAATQDIDLAGLLVDSFGNTITFARIKAIHIRVLGTGDDPLSVGGPVDVGGSNTTAFVNWISSNLAKVRIGGTAGRKGCFTLECDDATAYAVTPTTGDILRLTNVHATLSVKVFVTLIGSSA